MARLAASQIFEKYWRILCLLTLNVQIDAHLNDETRDLRIYAEFAQRLIAQAGRL
jgi:hypothetical protein